MNKVSGTPGRRSVESAVDAAMFFSATVRRRLDDVCVVDLYVRLTSTLDREEHGELLVSRSSPRCTDNRQL